MENTFRRAFGEFKKEYASKKIPVKFSECRGTCIYIGKFLRVTYILSPILYVGSFDRCEICYNAEALLKKNLRLSNDEREIIKVKSMHLLDLWLSTNVSAIVVCCRLIVVAISRSSLTSASNYYKTLRRRTTLISMVNHSPRCCLLTA